MELHEECLSFMREQVEDLNLDIAATIDWRNKTMRVLNKAKKLKEDLEALSSKVTEYSCLKLSSSYVKVCPAACREGG
jgi:hypothetical protein